MKPLKERMHRQQRGILNRMDRNVTQGLHLWDPAVWPQIMADLDGELGDRRIILGWGL